MYKKYLQSIIIRVSTIVVPTIIFFTTISAMAASVSLRWDPNDPTPEGYRVFARESGRSYNYSAPIWEDSLTTCTLIGLTEGVTYYFVVRAYDGLLESADSAEVTYTPGVVVANQAPTADAGQNQVVYEGDTVLLDGSGSSDADGTIDAFQWLQTSGIVISLNNATASRSSFTAPIVGLGGATLTFRLTVTDDDGSTSVDTITVNVLKSSSTDVDGDKVPDVLDLFPTDPNEWADNDADGIGDNQDIDDDNDGMSDIWETAYGLDPLTDDADLDADGDGMTNIDEFHADSDPTTAPGNNAPDAPVVDTVAQTERVELTPVLVTEAYFDADHDVHYKSQWQISTESDFSTLILDENSLSQLTAYHVSEMVLDTDTVYYWRVRFIDSRNGASDWSETATFTTLAAEESDDTDINGIPDSQEVNGTVDLNGNGTPDRDEVGVIMSAYTVEGQTVIGVVAASPGATLASIKSIPCDTIPDQSVAMNFGLIGFKLYLNAGVTTATVKIHFGIAVPSDAKLYKYTADNGWRVYRNAVLAADGKSITLMLEDGGMGDEDGVQNGVIVDPSGIAYTDSDSASLSTGGLSSGGGGGGGCFITTLQGAGQSWVDAGSGIWQWLKQSIGRCLALVNG